MSVAGEVRVVAEPGKHSQRHLLIDQIIFREQNPLGLSVDQLL